MKRKSLLLFIFAITLIILIGCTKTFYGTSNKENSVIPEKVTVNIDFKVSANNSKTSKPASPLSGVSILLIATDGQVIDKLVTNEQGEAQKDITVVVDHKYPDKPSNMTAPRGTVTAIAFKEGYRQKVLFEVPISKERSAQSFLMEPIITSERNEPDVQLGDNHHLEIISLVEKYEAILNNGH